MTDDKEKKLPEASENEVKKSGFNIKILLFGLPLFILQLVAIYFITANMLISKLQPASNKSAKADSTLAAELNGDEKTESNEAGSNLVFIKDIIINPGNTSGPHYLMIDLAIDIDTPEHQKILEERSIIVKDLLLNYLSSKSIGELTASGFKLELKNTLKESIKKLMKNTKVNDIYFSKYILN